MSAKKELSNGASEIAHEIATTEGPQGSRLARNLSLSWLAGGDEGNRVGDRVKASKVSEKCGLLWGKVYRGVIHPNFKNPKETSIRWEGEFEFFSEARGYGVCGAMYAPGAVERQLKSLGCPIILEGATLPPYFEAAFSLEGWCEPTTSNAFGFVYAVYDRQPRRSDIRHLCPPEIRDMLPAPAPEPAPTRVERLVYDPETGEVEEPDIGRQNGDPDRGFAIEEAAPIQHIEPEPDIDGGAPSKPGLRKPQEPLAAN